MGASKKRKEARREKFAHPDEKSDAKKLLNSSEDDPVKEIQPLCTPKDDDTSPEQAVESLDTEDQPVQENDARKRRFICFIGHCSEPHKLPLTLPRELAIHCINRGHLKTFQTRKTCCSSP